MRKANGQYVDCTPTWRGLLPLYFEMLRDTNLTRRKVAEDELGRLADAMDKVNAKVKEATR
ncbi:MAG: hypothetical protein WC822_02500 [Candidatus Paceibacterota bacterium]|jgi:hypothetical protein